ncbi:hypothetical protein SISSUDRAFT_1053431 [Sistotremastrum suecicum HHB10207 ss-3]|uniref:GST N-terminal domain-containing protein n=1 Tax=Sistotremastrum suecicum HHB10207 ss-3 TaxID=1314776 RepID=A0A165Z7K9_9AGAM|nr:hypothetical protein SISSUDRAFT_1053431 [Sistotremastrum suecicum HHB10207 ss-3]
MGAQEGNVITFYDIPSRAPSGTWSPNAWKTRFALGFKGVPHKTQWVEFPDVAQTIKAINGAPTSKLPDGSDFYTLPVISDPNVPGKTPTVISDSWNIALYLDKHFPSAPLLIPPGTAILQEIYTEKVEELFLAPAAGLIVSLVPSVLNEGSLDYFIKTREFVFGKKLEELAPVGPVRDAALKGLEANLGKIAGLLDKYGEGREQLFIAGDEAIYADLLFAAFLEWIKIVAEKEVWSHIKTWHGGRWERFLTTVEQKYGQL